MQLDQTAELFRADDGSAILFYGEAPQDLAVTPDGQHFFELKEDSALICGRDIDASCTDGRGKSYTVVRLDGNVYLNGQLCYSAQAPSEIDFTPLPVAPS